MKKKRQNWRGHETNSFGYKMAVLKSRVINLESENNQLRDRVQSQSSSNFDVVDQREVDQTYGEVTSSLSELRTKNEEGNEELSQLRDLLRSIEENRQARLQQFNESLEQQEQLVYDLVVERREQDEQMKRTVL